MKRTRVNNNELKKNNEYLLMNIFYQFLVNKGYPKDKLIREVDINDKMEYYSIPDIKILDKNNKCIAYVEVEARQSRLQLQDLIKEIKNRQVPNRILFIAIFIHDENEFTYARVNDDKIIYLEEFPEYNDLTKYGELNKKNTISIWNDFVTNVDIEKLKKIKKNIKNTNYDEGEKVRAFLKRFAPYLEEKIPKLKSYKWKLNQASTQTHWTEEDGFRLSFYKGDSLPNATQINITFWASWHGGVFIKDKKNLIFGKSKLIESLQKKYSNIKFVKSKKHIMAIHFKNGIPTEDEVINAIKQLLDILENIKSSNTVAIDDEKTNENRTNIAIPSEIAIKKKSEMESVLGVEAVANTLSSVIVKGFDDTGMMIGVFGKWGRGKTHFLEKLWDSIKEKKINYRHVLFSAWKYQDTKASWAYLYENIFNAYLDDVKNERTWIRKLKKYFKHKSWYKIVDKVDNFYIEKKKILNINIQKHSLTPIIIFIFLFIIAIIWSFAINKFEVFRYLITTIGIVLAIKLIIFYFAQKSSAIDLYKKYFFKNSFGNYLGLQSEIENELIILLKTWIPNPTGDKKIVLFVDDIDRCNIEQVIDIVDGLRVILDNPEIHSRLIIITAIDETILRQALEHKYENIKENIKDSSKIDSMYREYLEKIFIIGLKLNTLNNNEIEEILCAILPDLDEVIIDKNESNIAEDITDTSSVFDGDRIQKVTNTEKIAIGESVAPIIETQNNNDEVTEINIHEKTYLREVIKNLDNVTPRKIRIFYYKYLMMKILFDIRIREKGLISYWDIEKNEKIIIDLLIHLANDKESDSFEFKGNTEILKELTYVGEMVSVL